MYNSLSPCLCHPSKYIILIYYTLIHSFNFYSLCKMLKGKRNLISASECENNSRLASVPIFNQDFRKAFMRWKTDLDLFSFPPQICTQFKKSLISGDFSCRQSLKQDKAASTGTVEGRQVLAFKVWLLGNCVSR